MSFDLDGKWDDDENAAEAVRADSIVLEAGDFVAVPALAASASARPIPESAAAALVNTPKKRVKADRSSESFLATNLGLVGFGQSGAPLLQAVRELTENAIDAGAGRLSVRLSLAPAQRVPPQGGQVVYIIEVEDNGCGISSHALASLLGNVFSSTKAPCAAGSFGRYGVGVKAALLYATRSLQELGSPDATPLHIVTSTLEDDHVTSARVGLGGEPLAPLVACERYLKGDISLKGTLARLVLAADASTANALASGEELLAYFTRIALIPRVGGATIEVFISPEAADALGFSGSVREGGRMGLLAAPTPAPVSAFPLGVLSRIANDALENGRRAAAAGVRALLQGPPPPAGGDGGTSLLNGDDADGGEDEGGGLPDAPAQGGWSLRSEGVSSARGWQERGRAQLARALRVPLSCVSVGTARGTRAASAEVRVWIALTPDAAGGDGGGDGSGDGGGCGGGDGGGPAPPPPASRESALVHVLRFASSVPLLRGAGACALASGAAERAAWADAGLALARCAPRGGGAASRRALATLRAAPAAPPRAGARHCCSARVDAPGAWTASSAIAGFPLVPFAVLRVLVDARPARGGGAPLEFTDLGKSAVARSAGGAARVQPARSAALLPVSPTCYP
jgi:hypothetical protein